MGAVSSRVRYRVSRLFATSSIWRLRHSPSLCDGSGASVPPCASGSPRWDFGRRELEKKDSGALRNEEGSSARSCSMRSLSL